MAENEDGQEKSEAATPKRLEDARRKGQVPRSRELTTTAMLFMGAMTLMLMGEAMIEQLGAVMSSGLSVERAKVFDPWSVIDILMAAAADGLLLLLPFLLVMLATALAAPIALGGWSFSVEAMSFKAEKLNPLKGIKRIFAVRGLVELFKALAKFLLIGGIGAGLLWHYLPELMGLGRESVGAGMAHAGHILVQSFIVLSASLILIAAVDVPFQLWDHAKNMKMTLREVKDEHKNTEGKPEVKSRIRQMQREISQSRMMEEIPKADVVITNPTHFAVALRYDADNMTAPIVVAKGVELVASHIRTVAAANKVPLYEAPPLARALYYSTEINQEVSAGLYLAVAQILAYIFQLKASTYGGQVPKRPGKADISDDYFQGPGTGTGHERKVNNNDN
ncbi:Flagellar biosynthesis protein FlhB [hydrothermal vent metagenome]|uniref:Flagellar biosynthetic protein FlhB n=1 Tax=hydrothermal vent metagenome TaxID=652676 RepID=A0A3B0Z1W7_9ZZZZ